MARPTNPTARGQLFIALAAFIVLIGGGWVLLTGETVARLLSVAVLAFMAFATGVDFLLHGRSRW